MTLGNPYSIYYIDWLDNFSQTQYKSLSKKFDIQIVEMRDSMADVYRHCASISPTEYFFLLNGATDYTNFDFNYELLPWESQYLHVFGSGTWLGSKDHARRCGTDIKYIEAYPDLHFVKTDLSIPKQLLDIVYISNGEPLAEQNYQHLLKHAKAGNKIHRVDKVNGRTEAYQAAARVSNTPWFFAVFAKLEVNPAFDWTWLPDADSGPEHYVFNATNPINNLVYGHMAMIAYNKMLTLTTDTPGLDFTLSKPHKSIPLLSGTARYDQDPVVTWRTAFREVIKLRNFLKQDEDPDALYKIRCWESVGQGDYGLWSIHGADDANEYFDNCMGEHDRLKLTYEWTWLDQYFKTKYY